MSVHGQGEGRKDGAEVKREQSNHEKKQGVRGKKRKPGIERDRETFQMNCGKRPEV